MPERALDSSLVMSFVYLYFFLKSYYELYHLTFQNVRVFLLIVISFVIKFFVRL